MSESAARSMKAVVERRTVRAAGWARSIAAFSAVLLVVSGLAHRFGLVDTVPFAHVLAIVGGLAVLALVLALAAFIRIWRRGDRGIFSALVAMLIGLCVLAPFAVAGMDAVTYPSLADIATDPVDPPRLTLAARERTGGMNPIRPITPEAARLQAESYPAVAGRRYEYPESRVLEAVDGILADRGWRMLGRVEGVEGHTVTIEAVAKSWLLGFESDVAIRVFDDDSATFVDMRSASRYGRRDLGGNAGRILRFMSDLDDRMAALAGL